MNLRTIILNFDSPDVCRLKHKKLNVSRYVWRWTFIFKTYRIVTNCLKARACARVCVCSRKENETKRISSIASVLKTTYKTTFNNTDKLSIRQQCEVQFKIDTLVLFKGVMFAIFFVGVHLDFKLVCLIHLNDNDLQKCLDHLQFVCKLKKNKH